MTVVTDASGASWSVPVLDMALDGPTETPLGDIGYGVSLEECWRCRTTIPREDELGLCEPCRTALRDL